MKKHVTFIESNSDKMSMYGKTLRSSRLNHVEADKTTLRFGPQIQRPEKNRDIKTIFIPKTMTDAPFLQHPGLTPGQKRFLYNIAEAYSKDHVRQLIRQHYMNVLHRCIRTDVSPHVKPHVLTTFASEVEHDANSHTTTTEAQQSAKEHDKKRLNAEKVKKTTFPKIVNRPRASSRHPKPNKVQTRRKTRIGKHASSRESQLWDADLQWEAEMDSYLAGRISGLSFNESEDENDDFLFSI